MLLWPSKFATAKIQCSFEIGKETAFGGNIYFAGDGIIVSFNVSLMFQFSVSLKQRKYTTFKSNVKNKENFDFFFI